MNTLSLYWTIYMSNPYHNQGKEDDNNNFNEFEVEDLTAIELEEAIARGPIKDTSNSQANPRARQARQLNEQEANNMNNKIYFVQKSKRPVNHPLTNAPVAIARIQTSSQNETSFFEQCWRNVLAYRWLSISGSSKTTYASGWNHWKPFVNAFGTNLNLSVIPIEWARTPIPTLTFLECAISCFMAYLQDQKLQPKTIFTYVFGVLFFLKNMNIDITPVSYSKFVKSIKSGISHSTRLFNPDLQDDANSGKNLPLTVFMLVDIQQRVISGDNPYHICLCCAIHAAFVFLFRSCEFIFITDSEGYYHFLREQDVRFAILDESDKEIIISSSDAYKYASRYWANKHSVLVDVQTNVRHAKNDPEGIGNRFIHEIKKPDETRAFCIASMMFECAITCKPLKNWPFFSIPKEQKVISERDVRWAITESAKRFFKQDPGLIKRYTIRSCRVGGASALMSAGASDSYIKTAGRWKSNAFLEYLRVSTRLCQHQTTLMCQIDSGFTAEYIMKQYSRAFMLDG